MLTTERAYVEELMDYAEIALNEIVPFKMNSELRKLTVQHIEVQTGTTIELVGSIEGKLVLTGSKESFQRIGEAMFGMTLEDEMLYSFVGELGNMIAGHFSTTLSVKNISTDIGAPASLKDSTTITGYKIAGWVNTQLENKESLDLYILLD